MRSYVYMLVPLLFWSLSLSPVHATHKSPGPKGEPSVSQQRQDLRKELNEKFRRATTIELIHRYSTLIQKLDCQELGDDIYDKTLEDTGNKREAREAEFFATQKCTP